jgi:hypothetical protein
VQAIVLEREEPLSVCTKKTGISHGEIPVSDAIASYEPSAEFGLPA